MQKRISGRLWLAFLVLIPVAVAGQSEPVSLSVVTVRATAPERFGAGLKLQRIDSAALQQFRFQNLSDLLLLQTPLTFKNYGGGQISTVSFRGTSPNHTALVWNGVNVNQPMTGQTDFATLPTVGFDQVSVQYGSAGSAVGSDAVGGSILLRSLPAYSQLGMHISGGLQVGSFGNYQIQGRGQYTRKQTERGQFSARTVAYYHGFNNNYPYQQRSFYAVEPSRSHSLGFMRDLFWRNRRGGQWSLNSWISDYAVTVSPADSLGRERTHTQAFRFLSSYEADRWTVRLGWLRDVLDYAKTDFSRPSHSRTDRFLARVEREFGATTANGATWQVRLGGEAVHYRTKVDGYGGQLITENRADLYALFRYQTERLTGSINVRQGFVTQFDPPLTPSLGLDYQLLQRQAGSLTARASVGRSYRVPTLNERYWQTLGNPSLRPEHGLNAEAGLSGQWQPTTNWHLTTDLTTYRNRIDDWTYWNPDRGYRVENLQQVLARGLEWNGTVVHVRGRWRTGGRMGYAYTRTSQQVAYNAYAKDIVGKQLPYVPVHNTSLVAYAQHKQIRLTVQSVVQSRRYSTFDNSQALPGVVFTDLILSAPVRLRQVPLRVQGQVNNLFNNLILNVKQNAMPGRNFALNVVVN